MNISDEQIAAWLHGELTGEEAASMGKLIAGDPEATRRADRLRLLDEQVRQAIPETPLPKELLSRLGLASTPVTADVVDLGKVRAERSEASQARPRHTARFTSGALRIAAQLLIVIGIGFGAMQWARGPDRPAREANYRTLGDAPSAQSSANLLIMFRDKAGSSEANVLANRVGAELVGGPTAAGAWRFAIDPARRDRVLDELRSMPEVSMAEAIDGGPQ